MNIHKRYCDYCERYYMGYGKKFCSVNCRNKSQKGQKRLYLGENNPNWKGGKVTLVCKLCGKKFKVRQSKKHKAKYCSLGCKRGNKVELVCKQCNREFKVILSRGSKAKFCSRECLNKYNIGENHPQYKQRVSKVCQICNKEFRVIPSRSKQKFCSKECDGKWKLKYFRGKNHPWYGKHHSKETKEKMSIAKSGKNHPLWGKHASPETEFKKGHKLWETTGFREKIIRSQRKGLMNKPNKPEGYMIGFLDKNFPNEFCYNGNLELGVMIGKLIPDFTSINDKRKLIEVFGDYWHNRKRLRWYQTEFGRKVYYAQFGWDCLVLWEHELMDRPKYGKKLSEKQLFSKIKRFLVS